MWSVSDALAAVVAAGWSPKLGLDLQGGLSVVFQPTQKASSAELQTVVSIMQARANGLGLSSPNIGTQGTNIVVQLPGVKNPNLVLRILGSTSQLFFRPVLCRGQCVHAGQLHDHDHYRRPPTTTTVPASTSTSSTASFSGPGSAVKAHLLPYLAVAPGGYVKPPACGAAYVFTTATYDSAQQSNPGSAPDPGLDNVRSTTPGQDKPFRTVLIPNNPASGGPAALPARPDAVRRHPAGIR